MAGAEEMLARAIASLDRGDTAAGIGELKDYLALEDDDAGAWLALGAAYASIDHRVQAADAMRRAVDLDGDDIDARVAYARALVALKKLDDAAFQLLQAARLDEHDARVMKELGIVFYDKRLFDKAATWLAKASAAAPNDARASYALGLAEEARRDVGAAVRAYREATRRDPSFLDAKKTLADTLASMGEHERAIAELYLDALLLVDRANERAAENRDVLVRALSEMHAHRLLGKTARDVERSALVTEGHLQAKGPLAEDPATQRWTVPLLELWATAGEDGKVAALLLVLTNPARAAQREDDVFKVTVLDDDGKRKTLDFGTAATLTFLREALGCPMTTASALYARLLGGERVEWGGAFVEFATVPRPGRPTEPRHGVRVAARA